MATMPGMSHNVRTILSKEDFTGVAANISFAAAATGTIETEQSVKIEKAKFERKHRF